MKEYKYIGKIKVDNFKNSNIKLLTDEVILTNERLNCHILKYHLNEYKEIEVYLTECIEEPDYILIDNSHKDTLIFLKDIKEINKKARIVIKLATDKIKYNKNSIITLMRQRDKSWEQTLKNRGTVIFDKNE